MDEEKYLTQEFRNLITLFNKNKNQLKEKLNYILLNPLNTGEKFVKNKVEGITEEINKNSRDSELVYNRDISKVCQRQLELFMDKHSDDFSLEKKAFNKSIEMTNIKSIQESLKKYNVFEFNTVSQIQEAGENFEKIVAKIILDEKTNNFISIINDSLFTYYGVCVKKFEDTFLLNIIFIDELKSEDPNICSKINKTLKIDYLVFDYINEIRTNPSDHIHDFIILYNSLNIDQDKISRDKIKAFLDIIKTKTSMSVLNKRILLDELALKLLSKQLLSTKVLDNNTLLFDLKEEELLEYSKNYFISDSKFKIIGSCCKSTQNPQEILNNLLFFNNLYPNTNEIELFFKEENLNNIGIAFEINQDFLLIIIVLSKNHNSISKLNQSDLFKRELKRLRDNPKEFIHEFEKIKKIYNNINRYSGLMDNIEDLIDYMHHSKPLPEIELNDDLSLCCKEYCNFLIDPKNNYKFYTEDDDLLRLRLDEYVHGFKNTCEFVIYQNKDISEIMLNLLLEENVRVNKKGLVFFGKHFKYYGIAERIIRDKPLIIVIFTDYIQPKSYLQERLKSQFLKDLSLLRRNPRAFIKYLYNFRENKNAFYDSYKPEKDKNEIDKLADFLFKAKSSSPLEEKEAVTLVAEKYVFNIINKKSMIDELGAKKDNEDHKDSSSTSLKIESIINQVNLNSISFDIKDDYNSADILRKLFTNDFELPLNIQNIAINNFNDSKKCLVEILLEKKYREAILSPIYKLFGLSVNEKRQSLLLILCDEVNQKIHLNNYFLPDKTRFVRPHLTDDEESEIKNNFRKLDISNKGRIYPEFIMNLIEKNNLVDKNIVYFTSLQLFSYEKPEEALYKGIDLETFIEYTTRTLSLLSLKENVNLFNLLKSKSKVRDIGFEQFKQILNEHNFIFIETEAETIFNNICYPDSSISQKRFVETMDAIKRVRKGKTYFIN